MLFLVFRRILPLYGLWSGILDKGVLRGMGNPIRISFPEAIDLSWEERCPCHRHFSLRLVPYIALISFCLKFHGIVYKTRIVSNWCLIFH